MFPDDPPSLIKEDDDLEEIGVEKKMEPSAPGGKLEHSSLSSCEVCTRGKPQRSQALQHVLSLLVGRGGDLAPGPIHPVDCHGGRDILEPSKGTTLTNRIANRVLCSRGRHERTRGEKQAPHRGGWGPRVPFSLPVPCVAANEMIQWYTTATGLYKRA